MRYHYTTPVRRVNCSNATLLPQLTGNPFLAIRLFPSATPARIQPVLFPPSFRTRAGIQSVIDVAMFHTFLNSGFRRDDGVVGRVR